MPERFDEQQVAVARVYARALLDVARDRSEERLIGAELDALIEQLDSQPGFEKVLADPGIDEAERGAILERVLRDRANDLVVNTLQVMNRKGRGALLRPLVRAYREELEAIEGIVEANAITAVPLGDESRRRLLAFLERYTGKKVVLNEKVDELLIGGMVLRIGDQKMDSSVARELWRVGRRLRQRGSEELHTAAMMQADAG